MTICGIKVCFQVAGEDARKMADEFGGFTAADLMNQPALSALARIGPRDNAFNLTTRFVPKADRPLAEAYAQVLAETRARYCTPRATIRAEMAELRKTTPLGKGTDPFSKLSAKHKLEREEAAEEGEKPSSAQMPLEPTPVPKPPEETPAPIPSKPAKLEVSKEASESEPPVKETGAAPSSASPAGIDAKAESIKNAIIQAAGGVGIHVRDREGGQWRIGQSGHRAHARLASHRLRDFGDDHCGA